MWAIKERKFTIRGRHLADYLTIFRAKKEVSYYFEYLG